MANQQPPRIHPTAEVQTKSIGNGTVVWQYTVVLGNAGIGEDCNLNAHVFVENDVHIGDRVTIKCGVQIWDGITIEDDVFIGPNVTFTNDKYPRSKMYPTEFLRTTIRKGASIGANATILPGLTIGEYAMVGAGSVVTRDVPAEELWFGNPAKRRGLALAIHRSPGESGETQAVASRPTATMDEAQESAG